MKPTVQLTDYFSSLRLTQYQPLLGIDEFQE
jgi:hypothetical protein